MTESTGTFSWRLAHTATCEWRRNRFPRPEQVGAAWGVVHREPAPAPGRPRQGLFSSACSVPLCWERHTDAHIISGLRVGLADAVCHPPASSSRQLPCEQEVGKVPGCPLACLLPLPALPHPQRPPPLSSPPAGAEVPGRATSPAGW